MTDAAPEPLTDERIDAIAAPFESRISNRWLFDIRGFARALLSREVK